MDFEAFSSSYTDSSPPYSDSSSTPRTPSPRSNDPFPQPINFKHQVEPYPTIIHDSSTHYFHSDQHMIQNDTNWSYPAYPQSGRGSLLQELYDHDAGSEQLYQDVYIDDRAHYNEWQEQQHHHLHVRNTPHDHIARRATFPFVRHDQLAHPSQYFDQYPAMYPESFSVPDPSECHHDPQAIKLEDTPLIVPSQLGFSLHPPPSYLSSSPGTAVAIHHTDDAASKETQYLRRRCFNCHTTEPPSWRRSTLNPGKIVCNKCGLYERTHLRPRPLRFDELRAGGKTRKPAGASQGEKKGSKNAAPAPATTAGVPLVKKEPRELGLIRRGSVSSNASSNGAASDWDDNCTYWVTCFRILFVSVSLRDHLQCLFTPRNLPPLVRFRANHPPSLHLLWEPSLFPALLKVRQWKEVYGSLFGYLMLPSPTLPRCSNRSNPIRHPGRQPQLLGIFHHRRCTRVMYHTTCSSPRSRRRQSCRVFHQRHRPKYRFSPLR